MISITSYQLWIWPNYLLVSYNFIFINVIYSIDLSEEIISQYKNNGAALLKGVFEKQWVQLIEEGICRYMLRRIKHGADKMNYINLLKCIKNNIHKYSFFLSVQNKPSPFGQSIRERGKF